MKKISLILIIFFFLVGQNIAEPSDTLSLWEAYQKATKEVDEDKTLTFEEKKKVKARLLDDYYWKNTFELEKEEQNSRKAFSEIYGLMSKKKYADAFLKVKYFSTEPQNFLSPYKSYMLEKIIMLEMETDVPVPKDKVKALELKIKKLELRILSLELSRGTEDERLMLINSIRDRDISAIQLRLLDLEERLNKP